MKNNKIVKAFNNAFYKTKFELTKHSPEILTVVGVAGVVTSAVMACKATTKISKILEECHDDMETIHRCSDEKDEYYKEEYTSEDAKKDTTIVYIQTGVKIAKLYAPSVALGVASLSCLVASTRILHKRNAALAAAYATVDKSFKKYRERVVEKFGGEIDKEMRYGVKATKIEETVIDEETGKEKKVKRTVNVVDDELGCSEYAKFFDEGCKAWEKDAEYNKSFLRAQQAYANQLLNSRGILFLNEVYDMLGIPKTKAGQVVGWAKDDKDETKFVDFGIYDITRPRTRDFVNGYEPVILLDFNVDGYILDKMV